MEDLLNHPLIAERYFFPRPDQPQEYRDFTTADGVRLRCFESRPHPGAKTLVHYHGNGEVVADYLHDFVVDVTGLGLNVLLVEYRGYGGSTGEPRLGQMLDDVAVVRKACGIPSREVVLYGRSVGAIFALEWVAGDPAVAGLVLESGVADPHQRLALRLDPSEIGSDRESFQAACARRLSHQEKLAQYRGPLLVFHAINDRLVELSHAQLHMEWSKSQNKKLVTFHRGDHNTILTYNWAEMLRELGEFTALV